VSEHEPERYELGEPPTYRFEIERRGFLQLLGGVVVLLAADVRAQESGRGAGAPAVSDPLSAFLHIDEDGTVTVYTGKVEVGQDIRTSLAQAVAEELRAPVESIRLVMGDTERTPYDMGTFGSRSTPITAPQLRRAGAVARGVLVQRAAGLWEVPEGEVVIADGRVAHPKTERTVTFGVLTRGRKLVSTVPPDAALTPSDQWTVLGQSVPKVGGREIVTGRHRYTSDLTRPDLWHARVLRPPAIGATLAALDAAAARAMPDVVVVHDGEFAGVAAARPGLAERALAALRPQWKERALHTEDLYARLRKAPSDGGERPGFRSRGNDRHVVGAVAEALTAAARRHESTYTVAYIAHVPLEPRAAVAEWKDGRLTVWTGTQRPWGVRTELAQAFHVAEDAVRVIVPDTGSGYGGKHTGECAVEAARLAKAAGRPVKCVWTREEEFRWAYFRPAGVIDVKSGVDAEGTLTAWEMHNYNSGGSGIRTPYEVPHQHIEFHAADSPLRQGSYRGLAATANHFARESHMDELAARLAVDPLEMRLRHLKDPRLRAVLEAAAERFGWKARSQREGVGAGIACGVEKGGYVATCAEVEVPASGAVRVRRLVAAFECGAIVNPDHLRNQVEGALVQGLGGALFEAVAFEGGRITNASLGRYRVPRFADTPEIEVVLLDRKDLPSAGAGETPIVGVAPAVAGALFAATGQRLRALPLAPSALHST
jgi:isoquinoline 1-oxidoreductase